MRTIFRKELADYFTSIRFLILLFLVLLASAATLYFDFTGIQGTSKTGFIFLRLFTTQPEGIPTLFTFINFIAIFFIPIIGIALGFDAINGERSSGTISRILSQPIFRDSVINAKFLAGLFTLSIMVVTTVVIISGVGLRFLGVPPSLEEIFRLFIYVVITIIYGAFWMSLSILFSTVFRRVSTSLITSLAIWLIFGLFIFLIVPAITTTYESELTLMRFSPSFLFLETSEVLLLPPQPQSLLGLIGMFASGLATWQTFHPLSVGQSLLLIWPHLTGLLSLTIICFAVSYVVFMRQEIRAT
jgi:ABC-2 type transport system permease protein